MFKKLTAIRSGALRRFLRAESGTITTDYIILTGAIMGTALAGVTSVRTGVASLGSDIEGSLSSSQVAAIMVEAGPAPLRWIETTSAETAGSRCFDPATCKIIPPTRWEWAVLELDDGTKVTRYTTIEYPNTNPTVTEVAWFDEDGEPIKALEDAPDIADAGLICDRFQRSCTLPKSATK